MAGQNRTDFELKQRIDALPPIVRAQMTEILLEMLNGSTQRSFNTGALTTTTQNIQGNVTVGVAGSGFDVTFYGDTAGKFLTWDQSADSLVINGAIDLTGQINATNFGNSNAIYSGKYFSHTEQAITASANTWPTGGFIQLQHATVAIVKSVTIGVGQLWVINNMVAAGAPHILTMSGGTWDGTNNTATFEQQYDSLAVFGIAAGKGLLLANQGVTLSNVA